MAYMAMGMMGSSLIAESEYNHLTDGQKENLIKMAKERYRLILLKKGVREWNMDGITVLALNEKNAKRKANNIKQKLNEL